ncbi:MAG: ferritin-like domain-containing protein, partial [Ardenticatenaceae bacterium]
MSNQFYVDSSEENGTIFTNDQQNEVSVTFTASGTWNTGSKYSYGPEGKVGRRSKDAPYPNNTLYALLAVNSNNEVVGEGASIILTLQPDESVRFVVNDTHYPNNSGQLTVDWLRPGAGKKTKIVQLMTEFPGFNEINLATEHLTKANFSLADAGEGPVVDLPEVVEWLKEKAEEWLKRSLQAAIELEHATLPPYLCGMWSIQDSDEEAYEIIQSVAMEEMLHMSLVCNMLTTIGGSPQINTPEFVPTYPGPLPGGVRPQLTVGLQRLTPDYIKNIYMEIESPQEGETTIFKGKSYPTIGAFYDAILKTFQVLVKIGAVTITGENQLTWGSSTSYIHLYEINSLKDVEDAITEIVEQGEGTSTTPYTNPEDFGDHAERELAHYYKFGEIYHGRKFVKNCSGKWGYTGDPIPFPKVYPMAPVPPGGYPEISRQFDEKYSCMLNDLHDAWNGSPSKLSSAIGQMYALQPPALELMQMPIDPGDLSKGNYGPSFLYIPGLTCSEPEGPQGTPTWEADIKQMLEPYVACMLNFGADLGNYEEVKQKADDIYSRISSDVAAPGHMPPGGSLGAENVETFKAWKDADPPCPKATPPITSTPTWEHDIKDFFTEEDIQAMSWKFDLGKYEDVRDNADDIYSRITLDSDDPKLMPPKAHGGPWSQSKIDTFNAWMNAVPPCPKGEVTPPITSTPTWEADIKDFFTEEDIQAMSWKF